MLQYRRTEKQTLKLALINYKFFILNTNVLFCAKLLLRFVEFDFLHEKKNKSVFFPD